MEQEKIKAYYQMWSEAWKYFRKWAIDFKDTDDFWKQLVYEAESFGAKYKGTDLEKFAYRIASDIAEEIERVALERHEGKK